MVVFAAIGGVILCVILYALLFCFIRSRDTRDEDEQSDLYQTEMMEALYADIEDDEGYANETNDSLIYDSVQPLKLASQYDSVQPTNATGYGPMAPLQH